MSFTITSGRRGTISAVFSNDYTTDRYKTDWGAALNFDGPNSGPVREFFVSNARYWIEEFHFDGFRFDATQSIFDESEEHILAEIGARPGPRPARARSFLLPKTSRRKPG